MSPPSSSRSAFTLRPRTAEDDPRAVGIYSAQERDSAPLTVERYRGELGENPAEGERWVAVQDGRVLGSGSAGPAWWTGDPVTYSVEIRVDRRRGREGIGTSLLDLLRSRLLQRGARRLLGWVRTDAVDGRAFAARHGFAETGQAIQEYRLHVPSAATSPHGALEERLRGEGILLASLAELDPDDAFLRALQRLWAGAEAADDEQLRQSFPVWRREVLDAPGLSPETHWVAVDRGQPVGMTFLRSLSEDAAENDYTGVAATHRGRGIATALKLRAVRWARAHGVDWFFTSSEVGNAPMLGINTRLGYRPGPRRLEVALELA